MLHAAGRLVDAKKVEAHAKEMKDKAAAQKAAMAQAASVTSVTPVQK